MDVSSSYAKEQINYKIPWKILSASPPQCFFLIFALTSIYVLVQPTTVLLYDSLDYWIRGASFFSHGYFDFHDYDAATARNYIFPLFLGTIAYCGKFCHLEPLKTFQILNALFFSVFCSFTVPNLVQELSNCQPKPLSILAFTSIFLFFWHGFLLYPLTDLISLEFVATGCLLFLRSRRGFKIEQITLAFFLLTFAAITRPAYLLCLLLIPAVFLLTAKGLKHQPKNLLLFFCSGLIVVALMVAPQIYINKAKPYNSAFSGANLLLFQLAFGIIWEKYETTSGKDLGGAPQVIYCDHIGTEIFAREHLVAPFDFSKFRRVIRKYPVELIAIYGKHFFNGFDLQFSEPYPAKVFGNRLIFAFLNYTLLFIALGYLFVYLDLRRNLVAFLYSVGLLSPIIVAIPGAVEPRFFLPAFSLMYAIVSYAIVGKPKVFQHALKTPRTYLAYSGFMWLAITLSGATMANMYPVTPLFNGVPNPLSDVFNKTK